MAPAAAGVPKRRRGARKLSQKRNKSRGEITNTYCKLCQYHAEDSVEFDLHLNESRHVFNYLLYQFKEHR
ncbi:hypothetical protein L9F63_008112 [Diploptera punctata]|uniref:Uncharacterized protein n=1 Tax=Diploptera punctata TaxID=6984 RepID=A0AAD7Z6Y2_DIPPU|nr:hypothetical protein L9F63_008112 [Diploptera punctata]